MSKYRPGRLHPRLVSEERIGVLIRFGGSQEIEGELTNISLYGACVTVKDGEFGPGTHVLVTIFFSPGAEAFLTEADVVWSRGSPRGAAVTHGLRFLRSEEAQQTALEAILKRPGFTLESGPDEGGRKELDAMTFDLTEDLERLAKQASEKLGE